MGLSAAAVELGAVSSRAGFSPCPVCGAESRSSSERRRPPVSIQSAFKCYRCGAGAADSVDLVSLALHGRKLRELERTNWDSVREWFFIRGYCEAAPASPAPQKPQKRIHKPLEQPQPTQKPLPPPEEVRAVWAACVPVTDDEHVKHYLEQVREMDANRVAELGMARALPADLDGPKWWPNRWTARDDGHRLVVPVFNSSGQWVSLHARRIGKTKEQAAQKPKSRFPAGCRAGGLFMANRAGIRFLKNETKGLEGVLVCEGLTDTLRAATVTGEDLPLAVLGGVAGSWSELGQMKGRNVDWFHSMDPGEAGERYAEQIAAALYPERIRRLGDAK